MKALFPIQPNTPDRCGLMLSVYTISSVNLNLGIKAGKDLLSTLLISQSNRKRGKQSTVANSRDSYNLECFWEVD